MREQRKKVWDAHWRKLNKNKTLFSKFVEFYRKYIIANAVAFYLDKHFSDKGLFVECGSGTSQTSIMIPKRDRTFIALDISEIALLQAQKSPVMGGWISADVMKLPFKDCSIEGIWNLGVMEHFTIQELINILNEFHRILKKDCKCILFWPPVFGSSHLVLRPFEVLATEILRRKVQFFPDEISLLHSKKEVEKIMKNSRFSKHTVDFSVRDLFTHYIVVCQK